MHSKRACGVVPGPLGPTLRRAVCLMRALEMSQGDILALHSQLSRMPDTGPPALNLSSQSFTMRKKLLTMSCNISDNCHVLFQVSLGTSFPSLSPHGLSRLHVSVWSELNPRVLRSDLVGIRRRPQAQPFCPELPKTTPKFCVQGQSSDGNSHGPALLGSRRPYWLGSRRQLSQEISPEGRITAVILTDSP